MNIEMSQITISWALVKLYGDMEFVNIDSIKPLPEPILIHHQ